MNYPLPQAVEFSTLVLLAQTFVEFVVYVYRNTKKAKPKFSLMSFLGYTVVVGIVLNITFCFVIFFDYCFRSLVVFLMVKTHPDLACEHWYQTSFE